MTKREEVVGVMELRAAREATEDALHTLRSMLAAGVHP